MVAERDNHGTGVGRDYVADDRLETLPANVRQRSKHASLEGLDGWNVIGVISRMERIGVVINRQPGALVGNRKRDALLDHFRRYGSSSVDVSINPADDSLIADKIEVAHRQENALA